MAILLAVASAAMVVVIHEHWMPWHVAMHLRAWWLHFFGVLTATLTTGLVLGLHRRPREGRGNLQRQLACFVPFVLLGLHEFGQWLYPDGARDTFDCVRDASMNAVGTTTGWLLQRFLRPAAEGRASVSPRAPESPRRP